MQRPLENLQLEKDYVYLYTPMAQFQSPIMRVQAPSYALETSTEGKIGLSKFGFLDYEGDFYKQTNFDCLSSVESKFFIESENEIFECTKTEPCYTSDFWYWRATYNYRIIEAGRYVAKFDIMDMFFSEQFIGRYEVFATKNSITLKFDGYNKGQEEKVKLTYKLTFPNEYKLVKNGDKVVSKIGNHTMEFSVTEDCSLSLENNTIIVSKRTSLNDSYNGLTLRIYIDSSFEDLNKVKLSYYSLSHNKDKIFDDFNNDYGTREIRLIDDKYNSFEDKTIRNNYDRVVFTLKNESDKDVLVPLCFIKEGFNTGLEGVSPMIRDALTLEPTGETMQVTKDWHIHPDPKECEEWFSIPLNAPRRYLEGKWAHLYAYINVPANSEITREYTCAYENWGKVCGATHSQLSLVGWGGYYIWEQLAFGCHGENICFQSDTSSNTVSFINDIRPMYSYGKHGGNIKYGWSDNVGGGELLSYEKDGKFINLCDSVINFNVQCPVITETRYKLKSQDQKIETSLVINATRTNDVTRIYFHIRYDFVEDVEYDRLSFFQLESDRYLTNFFSKLSYGNDKKIVGSISLVADQSQDKGIEDNSAFYIEGDNPWIFMYEGDKSDYYKHNCKKDYTDLLDSKRANNGIIVRYYNSIINGVKANAPKVNIYRCKSTDFTRKTFNIIPEANGKVEKGSFAEMTIEFFQTPNRQEYYYGDCSYIKDFGDRIDSAEVALYEARENAVQYESIIGKVLYDCPLTVQAQDDYAKLKLSGGLGYVPVRFKGLSNNKGIKLFIDNKEFDDGVKGNDFYQVKLEENKKTYEYSFTIPASKKSRTIEIKNIK